MRKIKNPYAASGRLDYQCFGCSPNNPIGLHLEFWEKGEEVIAKWMPRKSLQGFRDVLHGGIQATLLDEIAGWVVQTQCKTAGVTTSMEVSYLRPVLVSDGEITLRGKVMETGSRMAIIGAELLGHDGKVCASAVIKYFLFSEDKATKEYFYPGADAF
ncbi:MAG: PaaI family thioesterase [Bacteroidia bacterium]|nr:PaaI family thioesterase [Bacteroidia bacterium]